jgi:hypothetical protein
MGMKLGLWLYGKNVDLRVFQKRVLRVKVIGETWFPGLTLKTVLNWDLYWNK